MNNVSKLKQRENIGAISKSIVYIDKSIGNYISYIYIYIISVLMLCMYICIIVNSTKSMYFILYIFPSTNDFKKHMCVYFK